MYSSTSTPRTYPKGFQEIYDLSKDFCAYWNADFDEIFHQAVKLYDSQYSEDQIWEILERNRYQGTSKMHLNATNPDYSVWLAFGPTGAGKSTFSNTICGAEVAVEGEGINSMTKNIGLHTSDKYQIHMIDTPGWDSTSGIKNEEISNQVVEFVQRELKQNAHIDAIFFLWCPTSLTKVPVLNMLKELENGLGDTAINSVVFLINKVSDLWHQIHKNHESQFVDMLRKKGLNNPVVKCDLKRMTVEEIQGLKKLAKRVNSYRKEDFEAHRMAIYLNKFLEIQRIDEEKKRERENIEKEMKENFKQSARQMEQKFSRDMKKQEEQHQAEMENARQQMRQLEIRLERERAEREAEERRRKEEDERRRRKEEEERIRYEEQRRREEEQRRHEEEQRRREEEQRRHEENQDSRGLHQILGILEILGEEEARSTQPYYPSYTPSNYLVSDYCSIPLSTSASTGEMKFYKGGWYLPGPGKRRAPKGGCYMPVSSSSSHTASSLNSGGGGGKFYKGGQFMPGGGRAPKGGAWA